MGFFSKLLNQSQPAACVLPETHAVIAVPGLRPDTPRPLPGLRAPLVSGAPSPGL